MVTGIILLSIMAMRPAPGMAQIMVINNGLTPYQDGTNAVIGNSLSVGTSIHVRDLFCDATVEDPCAFRGQPTTVSLIGNFPPLVNIEVRESSRVEHKGGLVSSIRTRDSSSAEFTGGQASLIQGLDKSSILLDSTAFQSSIELFDTAFLRVLTAAIGTLVANGGSHTRVDFGDVSQLTLNDSASMEMSYGNVQSAAILNDSSSMLFEGGSIPSLILNATARATVRGGSMSSVILVNGTAQLRIEGNSFAVDGLTVPFGPLTARGGRLSSSGTGGPFINVDFGRAAGATIELARKSTPSPFVGLGDLPGEQFLSTPSALSDDGLVVVGTSRSSSGLEAFRWTRATGMVGLGGLGGAVNLAADFLSSAVDTNGDGSMVVGNGVDGFGNTQGFVWTNPAGAVTPPELAGAVFSTLNGISASGEVLVGSRQMSAGRTNAFRLEAGDLTLLGQLTGGSDLTNALLVSNDGAVATGEDGPIGNTTARTGFRWTVGSGIEALGDLPGGDVFSIPRGISGDGSQIFGLSGGSAGFEGFRWEGGSMTSFGQIPAGLPDAGEFFLPGGSSADGSVVVGTTGLGSGVAYVWTEADGFRPVTDLLAERGIDIDGWELTSANRVSVSLKYGMTIVGEGINPNGRPEAWLLPEPAGGILSLVALATLASLGAASRRT